jgi:hypothetical protein
MYQVHMAHIHFIAQVHYIFVESHPDLIGYPMH